ncbi:hypothetical protein [Micromonospora globbae]|uniref:hypothetical protein n=1 Tax=Micromonospora globbae TaxID=1894969 RepID=UPI00343B5955
MSAEIAAASAAISAAVSPIVGLRRPEPPAFPSLEPPNFHTLVNLIVLRAPLA